MKNVIVVTDKVEEEIDLDKLETTPICLHYIKWEGIKKSRKSSDEYSQSVFNFINQYVTMSDNNEYVCKSCGHKNDFYIPITSEFFWPST